MQRHATQSILEMAEEPKKAGNSSGMVTQGMALLATEEMRGAKAWLEVIEKPPVPDNELLAIHGWLSPEGILYACGWERHNELTEALGYRHESDIEKAGYCKLTQLKWLVGPRYCERGLTNEQWETIEKWYERNGFPEEHFIRLSAIT
jgi:hypothetical protein